MGGKLYSGERVKREHVEGMASMFMISVIPGVDYRIAGSYRRGADTCGDIELVIPCRDEAELSRVRGCIAKQFGCTESGTANMHGLYGCVQYDLFPILYSHMGACMLHATGSWQFNKWMRKEAMCYGLLLNQYGLFNRKTNEPVLLSSNEEDFFKRLGLDFVDPINRSIK